MMISVRAWLVHILVQKPYFQIGGSIFQGNCNIFNEFIFQIAYLGSKLTIIIVI